MNKETIERIIRHNRAGIAAHQLWKEMERIRQVLRNLMPFALEEYYPDYATPEYKAAMESAKAEIE